MLQIKYHLQENNYCSSKLPIKPEGHLFMQDRSCRGNSGLDLSTDAKPRLKWTSDLHERFIEAVNQLGGADKATPKSVLKLMGIQGFTLYHFEGHLQVQRHLQLRIETQGKYLQAVVEKAQVTLGRQNLSEMGLEAPKVQLLELVSKASDTHHLNSASSGLKSLSNQPTNFSLDSCLTNCEVKQMDQDMIDLNYLNRGSNAPLKSKKNTYEPDNECDLNLDISQNFRWSNFEQKPDLNAHAEYDPASSRKQFDLNGDGQKFLF